MGPLYGKVQCNMANDHIGTRCKKTDTTENITFPQLRWRAVITFCFVYQFVLKERPSHKENIKFDLHITVTKHYPQTTSAQYPNVLFFNYFLHFLSLKSDITQLFIHWNTR